MDKNHVLVVPTGEGCGLQERDRPQQYSFRPTPVVCWSKGTRFLFIVCSTQLFFFFRACCQRSSVGSKKSHELRHLPFATPCRSFTTCLLPFHLFHRCRRLHHFFYFSFGLMTPKGDSHLVERMLPRSISLLCRHPKPVSVDLTFETADLEERFRRWVNKRLTIR